MAHLKANLVLIQPVDVMHGKPVFLNTENIYHIGDLAGVFHITQDATNIQCS